MWLQCVLLLLASSTTTIGSQSSTQNSRSTFDWETVTVSSVLEYSKCYGHLECARLEVPLDWNNASNPNKVALAVVRLPSKVHHTDPSFGGTILVNPGGPGGSGVNFVHWIGAELQETFDSEKQFEILSWDPRGVHYTNPSPACFSDDKQRQIWALQVWEKGSVDASHYSFDHIWAAYEGFGQLCAQTQQGVYPDGHDIRQFATTALTARDMVEIIDQVESHRKRDGKHHINWQQTLKSTQPALLNYYGLSYGTHLGNTFASMFPDRIGRMILDGNVDPDDYMRGTWSRNLQDNNRTIEIFFEYCFMAGSACALYDMADKKPCDLASRVFDLLEHLRNDPMPVLHNNTVSIVSRHDVAWLMHSWLYIPNWRWTKLAEVLSELILGNATSMIPYLKGISIASGAAGYENMHWTAGSAMNASFPEQSGYAFEEESERVIICGDSEDLQMTKTDTQALAAELVSQSPIIGPLWAIVPLACTRWPKALRPASHNRFVGPFSSNQSRYDSRASPLLFIGNTADPVTPLRNSFKSASRHEGARVLIQDSPGHGTGWMVPSACTISHIKRFFAHGVLPVEGTVCKIETTPWGTKIET